MYNLKKNVHQQYELCRWQSFGSGAWHGRHWAPTAGGAAQHSLEQHPAILGDCAGWALQEPHL